MNVLFLDYDGVVNTLVLNNEGLGNLLPNGFYSYICSPKDNKVSNTQAVLLVDMLCKKYNLVIVLTTTWRLDFDLAKSALYNSGLSKDIEIVGKTLRSFFWI